MTKAQEKALTELVMSYQSENHKLKEKLQEAAQDVITLCQELQEANQKIIDLSNDLLDAAEQLEEKDKNE